MQIAGLDVHEAAAFCGRWLPAWTGNQPEKLANFYTGDAFYADPARPGGLTGRPAILDYFQKLLRRYPEWIWMHRRSLPLPDGFLNYWAATISADDPTRAFDGVCIVQLRGG